MTLFSPNPAVRTADSDISHPLSASVPSVRQSAAHGHSWWIFMRWGHEVNQEGEWGMRVYGANDKISTCFLHLCAPQPRFPSRDQQWPSSLKMDQRKARVRARARLTTTLNWSHAMSMRSYEWTWSAISKSAINGWIDELIDRLSDNLDCWNRLINSWNNYVSDHFCSNPEKIMLYS